MYITTREELNSLCERIKSCDTLALDTEFVWETTYYHRLGLIQVAGSGVFAAIDPILVKDLTPFLNLVKKTDIVKVFHAAKQDLEILHRLCGEVIRPVFDTQIAASLVGWGSQISFAKIVQKVTGKKIDKAETYTDWCRRPLSKNQIDYALDDVRYLVPVYDKLKKVLRKMDREEWVKGELKFLEKPETFAGPEPDRHYLKIKNIRNLQPRNLAVLNELAFWRDAEARKRDTLPKSVVRDEPLVEIARILPKDLETLSAIRGMGRKEVKKSGQQIFEVIQKGLKIPEDQYPLLPQPDGYSPQRGVEELLAAYVQIRAEELKIEPSVLADRKQIHNFVKCYELGDDVKKHYLFQGWRKDSIGSCLYSILDGKMGLAIDKKGKVNLFPTDKN
ncbi:MAG: ribonuclease D [Nitrospinota bacterium]|nr:ribonuclease D [Nitrospinota bacterium]